MYFKHSAIYFLIKSKKISSEIIETVVKITAYDLVIEAAGTFKWYIGMKVIFYKAANPNIISEPSPFFRTDPFTYYHKCDDSIREIVKEQLENRIDNYERNESGSV